MKIEVNISKTYLFVILGAILILAGSIYVYATVDQTGAWHDASTIKLSNEKSVEEAINTLDLAMPRDFEAGDIVVLNDPLPVSFIIRHLDNDYQVIKSFTVGQSGSLNVSWGIVLSARNSNYPATSYVAINGVKVGDNCDNPTASVITCSRILSVQPGDLISVKARGGVFGGAADIIVTISNFKVSVSQTIPAIVNNAIKIDDTYLV